MSAPVFSLVVGGRPVPKGRPRARVNQKTGRISVYNEDRTVNAEAAIEWVARNVWKSRAPLTGPLSVTLVFRCSGWCGDLDNLGKLVLDALQTARVFTDDRHVWRLSLSREASSRADQSTSIRVEAL